MYDMSGDEIIRPPDRADLWELRHELAVFLREKKEALARDLSEKVKAIMSAYESLPGDVLADVRQSYRDFIQLYIDFFESEEFPAKYIKSACSDIGKKRAGQGIGLHEVIASYDEGETYVWNSIGEEFLERDYSRRAWFELAGLRDRFNKLVRHYLRRSYEREEQASAERRLQEFRALSALGQTIVSTMDLEKVLGQILEVATSLMQTRMGAVLLLDDSGEALEPVADMGLARSWVQREKLDPGRSLAGVAIRRDEPVLAKDAELTGFDLPRVSAGRKIRSALSIPITAEDQAIGVIELYDTVDRGYTDLDITMMTTFGSQAGVAIKNASLFEQEQRRRRQANILTEMAQAFSETRDLEELLDTITEKTARALGADRCSLFFYEPEANALTFMAGYGRSTLQVWLLNQFHVPMDELGGATARAIREGRPVLAGEGIEEMSLESRIFRGPGVRSYLQVPLAVEDELIALMSLEITARDGSFSAEDVSLADSLAMQAAVAIQNRKLQEKLFEQQLAIKNVEVNERLYREREKSEAVLKSTPDAVLVIDRDFRVVLSNPAVEYLTGWSEEEARGRSCHEVLYGTEAPPGTCLDPNCPIRKVFEGEPVTYSEEELLSRRGRRVPVGGTFAPIYGPDGKIENVMAMYRDISQQKELEHLGLLQKEMEIASGIQSSLLPRERLLAGGVSVRARQQQAKIVGGDWYDYWWQGDKVFLVIGDASGSGVGAALFATMAMSALRVEAREHDRISTIIEHVNQNLYLANRSENFVTVFFGVLDLPTMTLEYSNAGHEDPLCIGAEDRMPEPLTSGQRSLLGMFARPSLDVRKREFNSGERLVLFTDGVIDAQNSRGKFYGLKRLNRFVAGNRDLTTDELIDALIENVLDFCNGEPRDDVTVMVCDIP